MMVTGYFPLLVLLIGNVVGRPSLENAVNLEKIEFDDEREIEAVRILLDEHRRNWLESPESDPQIVNAGHMPRFDKNISDIPQLNSGPNGKHLYEGDIVLTIPQALELLEFDGQVDQQQRSKRGAYRDRFFPMTRWTSPIPYVIDSSIDSMTAALIRRSIKFWQDQTCVSFVENGSGPNRLNFIKGAGCYSYIGRVPQFQKQDVSIGAGCEHFGIVTHEIGHAMGFFHTQSRLDRDAYVTLNLNNIPPQARNNYNKESARTNENYGLPYEYGSIMHYSAVGFAVNANIPVMIATDEKYKMTMGSRTGPSFYDVKMMNAHYECNACAQSRLKCFQGGYPDPRNCAQCKCPSGFAGTVCQLRQTSTNASCGATIPASTEFRLLSGQLGSGVARLETDFTYCFWHITSPPNTRIEIKLDYVGRTCSEGCFFGGLEMKMTGDMAATGYRYCCSADLVPEQVLRSADNLAVLSLFNRYFLSQFQLQYRYVPMARTQRG